MFSRALASTFASDVTPFGNRAGRGCCPCQQLSEEPRTFGCDLAQAIARIVQRLPVYLP